MDLRITNARLLGKPDFWDITISEGTIQTIAQSIPDSASTTLNAQQQLVIPGLVDAHMHLDKVFLLDRCQQIDGTFAEAMQETLKAKRSFTLEDIQARARRAIEQAISFGTTAMRSHVEVDPSVGLTGINALLPLREEYRWGITLQLAVFAQEGITNQPGTDALLRQAMALGVMLLGQLLR